MAGRAVLVTGASTGIGKACVVHLAGLGHAVFAGVRKAADGAALQEAIGERVEPILLDVTDASAIADAQGVVRARVGASGLAGLVNNAGVALGGPLEYLSVETWRTQLEVNVIGQIAVTQAMLPLIRDGKGRVVFIGSMAGRFATPMMGPYNASKFALEGISESFRQELRPWGLKVALIEPGAIKTDIWGKGRSQADDLEANMSDEAKVRYASFISGVKTLIDRQDRMAIGPERVAKVVEHALFAPRPRSRYLVGIDAKIAGVVSRLLPDQAKDAVFRRISGFNPPLAD